MLKKACARFEKSLQELHDGLSRPRRTIEAVWRRIAGRGPDQLASDPVAGSKSSCLRQPDRAGDLWRLTDPVFRSAVGIGVRPIYHQKQQRSNGHLFITVLAYQLVQVIRRRLREQNTMVPARRVTARRAWQHVARRSVRLGVKRSVGCSVCEQIPQIIHLSPSWAGRRRYMRL